MGTKRRARVTVWHVKKSGVKQDAPKSNRWRGRNEHRRRLVVSFVYSVHSKPGGKLVHRLCSRRPRLRAKHSAFKSGLYGLVPRESEGVRAVNARCRKDEVLAEMPILTPENTGPLKGDTMNLKFVVLKYVYKTLMTLDWNRSWTASDLGISLRSVRDYIKDMRRIGWTVPNGATGGRKQIVCKRGHALRGDNVKWSYSGPNGRYKTRQCRRCAINFGRDRRAGIVRDENFVSQ